MSHEEFLLPYLPTKQQKLAINVGAHEGIWIDRFKDLFSGVIAIEANLKSADVLRKKYPAPPVGNVSVIDAAAWICSGQTMDFHVRDREPMESALSCRDLRREEGVSETTRVPTISIDELGATDVDLIWCDVEGSEIQVMQGATRTIEAYRPQVVIECHELEHRNWLMTWLERAGYNLAIVHHPGLDQGDSKWDRNVWLIGHHWRYRGTW